eukprot:scaffold91805_cov63-Phaeocystis_antarctica.AAC.2
MGAAGRTHRVAGDLEQERCPPASEPSAARAARASAASTAVAAASTASSSAIFARSASSPTSASASASTSTATTATTAATATAATGVDELISPARRLRRQHAARAAHAAHDSGAAITRLEAVEVAHLVRRDEYQRVGRPREPGVDEGKVSLWWHLDGQARWSRPRWRRLARAPEAVARSLSLSRWECGAAQSRQPARCEEAREPSSGQRPGRKTLGHAASRVGL